MEVCRVCLSTNVKMYHILKHKLNDMFERVAGIEIKTEDKLPQMLCWECFARLSSANCFIVKALKTQWMLNKMCSNKLITINDIESIDKVKNQLKSSLGLRCFKVNDCDLHIVENIVDTIKCKLDSISDQNTYNTHETMNVVENENIPNMKVQIIVKEELDESNQNNHIHNKNEAHYESVNINFNEETKHLKNLNKTDNNYIIESCENEEFHLSSKYKIKSDPEVTENQVEMSSDKAVEDIRDISKGKAKTKDIDLTNQKFESNKGAKNTNKQIVADNNESNNEIVEVQRSSNIESHHKLLRGVIEDKDLSNSSTLDSCEKFMYKGPTTICNKTAFDPTILFKDKNSFSEEQANIMDTTAPFCHSSDPENTSQTVNVKTDKVSNNISHKHKNTESSKSLFTCDICNTTIHNKTTLLQHIQEHANLYSCNYCTFKTCYKRALNSHIDVKHIKTPLFKCSYCNYVAHRKAHLNEHINSIHTKKVTFSCSFCTFKTLRKRYLREHINGIHTKNISFDCTHCNYKTYLKNTLEKHVIAKHKEKKSYNCALCDFKTFQKSYLRVHNNIKHTKNVSFNCTICSYNTCVKSNLKKHVNAKHTKKQ